MRSYQQRTLTEKLFLHLDRPMYLSGETMWFKVYATDGTYLKPLPFSSVAYVEVLNQASKPVLQGKIPLQNATGQGSFNLPASLPSGSYTVRAYSRWMQNFGPDYFFQQVVTVLNTATTAGAALTDSVGYEVQFFPEGGNLVWDLSSRIGFKATDNHGRGVAATGKVLNQFNQVVVTFRTGQFGMGSFVFQPEAGNIYRAEVAVAEGTVLKRELPKVFAQGYVMQLQNTTPAILTVAVRSTNRQPETIWLLAHSRQQVVVAAQAELIDGSARFTVRTDQLLEGVSHFTLFNSEQKPLCERLYFRPPVRQLAITASAEKTEYTSREKVRVQLTTASSGTSALPLAANLSMSVYRLDSLTTGTTADINSYLWLSADLKGTIENPDYYFTAGGPERTEAADNLMLTQGWSRFKWEHILARQPPWLYRPELHAPVVQARLTHATTNAPVPNITTYMSSPSRLVRLGNAVSDSSGLVEFETNELYGSRDLVLQTDPKQDSTCRITLLPAFSTQYAARPAVAQAPASRFETDYQRRHLQAQLQNIYFGKYRNRYTLPPTDSTAFYGKPDEVYMLDKYTRFKVLEEVMREYVPGVVVRLRKDGFHFIVINKLNRLPLPEDPMVLLDGVPVFNTNKIMALNPLKIQKLEVMDGRYFHGTSLYNGVVSYTTYKGDLEGFQLDPRVLVQQYEGLQAQREFYAPRYETAQQKQSRLPDLRNLLYWNPNLTTPTAGTQAVEFYTGDQPGRYLVEVQGLSADGLPGSTRFTIEVKPAL
ncbi:hypothetical protein [Hymenobacter canadensis]|uniref:Macroglobulin domain-containing protein n=1 Tax=Hymenobacter canadensis TaxID=2999067 RepID=A0ABY7LLT8_9BACT|nr:hypothetical protein [Hymenobacter canadensis]WBA41419.1 hypothetical protein O3303_16575 [Hymenobacter canadensis]